ncbi:MAG: hypothetical protein IKX02_03330 [Spirochaetales bacterium]|nr:hypothetical protein [Spirochaetales bacterium]
MSRIFKDCEQMIREIDRELKVSGITVPVKHYQNKELTGDSQKTKELIGVNFTISKPYKGRREMLEFLFRGDADRIERYCNVEFKDRIDRRGLNPGNSYLVRLDLWQQFMSRDKDGKFDYTYSERMNDWRQLDNAISALEDDKNSRRAMVMVFRPDDTCSSAGFATRIPCSISYQFLIRNDRLIVIYYTRSNDYFNHFAIDIWLAAELQAYMVESLLPAYPSLKAGQLEYFAGSLHAYYDDIKQWVIF